jgi:U3 small nucleolar RNA-associated protein 23
MRLQRHKAARRTLAFFRLAFGLAPPYKVLLDGNFLAQAVRMSIEFARLLPKLLHAESVGVGAAARAGVFLHVTECCLAELRSLGPKGAPVVAAATAGGAIGVIRCRHKHGHAADTDASECIRQLVGPANAARFLVATQDAQLRDAMRRVAGVPVVLLSQNVLVLEPPSDASRQAQAAREASRSAVQPSELAAIARAVGARGAGAAPAPAAAGHKRRREEEDGAEGAAALGEGADGDGSDGGDEGAAAAAAAAAAPARRPAKAPASLPALLAAAGVTAGKRRDGPPRKKKRRGGPSEPNPLAVRKRAAAPPPAAPAAGGGSGKPRRRKAAPAARPSGYAAASAHEGAADGAPR